MVDIFKKLGQEKLLMKLLIQSTKYGHSLGKFILEQSNIYSNFNMH